MQKIGFFDMRLTSCGDLDFAWHVQARTDWQIKLVPQATIYYQYRRDLPSLARQFRKNGWGYGLLALKWSANPDQAAHQMMVESLILIGLSVARHSRIRPISYRSRTGSPAHSACVACSP